MTSRPSEMKGLQISSDMADVICHLCGQQSYAQRGQDCRQLLDSGKRCSGTLIRNWSDAELTASRVHG